MARKRTFEWGPHDDALIYTCSVLHTIRQRRWQDLADVQAHFRPQEQGERILLDRPYELRTWGAPGTGAYVHDSSFFFATGRGAAPLVLGHMAGRALGNRSRRAAAAAAATPRWMATEHGHLFVSTHGFYIHNTGGLHRWDWSAIAGSFMAGRGLLDLQGLSTNGPIHWQVASDAAELVFVLWALAQHHDHPQLVTNGWLPPGWVNWAHLEHGHAPAGMPLQGGSAGE